MLNCRYVHKNSVCQRAVFVDGLARTGKFLACRIISHLEKGEHAQYQATMEHMCYMFYVGSVSRETATSFLQFNTEEQTYNRMVGRFLNTRRDDASSIFLSPHHEEYIERASAPSGEIARKKFNEAGFIPVYPLHNGMVSGSLIFDAMPWAQLIHLCRHPINQTYKWFERGWGWRDIEDPLSFIPLIETHDGTVPWYAHNWAGQFLSGNAMERALDSVLKLQEADDNGFAQLSAEQSRNVLRLPLERLLSSPEEVIKEISNFLGSSPHKKMVAMLKEEGLPLRLDTNRRQEMLDEISNHASPDRVERLLKASKVFEQKWKF